MIGEGTPFQGHEGMEAQVERSREELVLALEKWRILVDVGGSQACQTEVEAQVMDVVL